MANSSSSENDKTIESQLAAQAKHDLLSNDLLVISSRHLVTVTGQRLKLQTRPFTVLVLLAEQAAAFPGSYISTAAMILAIKQGNGRLGQLGMSWNEPTEKSLYDAVCDIRAELKRAEGDHDSLIQNIPVHGYRLSAPAINIIISPSVRIGFRLRDVQAMRG